MGQITFPYYIKNKNFWEENYKEETCYNFESNIDSRLLFSEKYYYELNDFKILNWSDFMEKQYNLGEVMSNFKEGTKFKCLSDGKIIKIKNGIAMYLSEVPVILKVSLMNSKFIKIEEPKRVYFNKAIKAYLEGKTIKVKIRSYETVYKPRGVNPIQNYLLDEDKEAITPNEILNGKWYIMEDNNGQ